MKIIVLALSLFAVAHAASYENKGGYGGEAGDNSKGNANFGSDHGSNGLLGAFDAAADFGKEVIHQGKDALKSLAGKIAGGAEFNKHGEIGGHVEADSHSASSSANKLGGESSGSAELGKDGENGEKSKVDLSASSSTNKPGADGESSGHVKLDKDAGYVEKSNDGSTAPGSAGQSDSVTGGVAIDGGAYKDSKIGSESSSQ